MRFVPVTCLAVFALGCATGEHAPTAASAPSKPLASLNDLSKVDLVGKPDLFVREDVTAQQWVVRDENLPANYCSVIEGGVQPGVHRIIRFTVMTPNVGDADIYIGSPLQHYLANDGLYEFAQCHQHFHFKHYATYKLIDPATGKVWKAAKRGFCMLDTDPAPYDISGEPPRDPNFLNCGTTTADGFQGISHGWADTYRFFLGGQYFVLDGGDGQPVVPPGVYTIRIEVNPAYAPDKKGNCPRVKDPLTGLCHQFAEASYANNVGEATVQITDHPGRAGYGPLKNDNTKIKASDEIEKE